MTTRISPTHQWLIDHGWKRDDDIRIGNRIQARWYHPRNGGITYSTDNAETNELYHQRRVAAAVKP